MTGPIIVPQELLQRLRIVGLLEKACILCTMESIAQSRHPCQVWFVAHTS